MHSYNIPPEDIQTGAKILDRLVRAVPMDSFQETLMFCRNYPFQPIVSIAVSIHWIT